MAGNPVEPFPQEDMVFRLRAKMEDHSYTHVKEGGQGLLAFRVPGDSIDLLRSLEYLSEFLDASVLEEVEKVLIISDREYEVTPGAVMAPKMETKRKDDERVYNELKDKLHRKLEPIVFTEENDILELYRTAIRMEGSLNRTDSSVGLDLIKVDLPKEGDVIYLVFDDGYRKLSRATFEKIIDRSMEGLRQGPALAKDPVQKHMEKQSAFGGMSKRPGPSMKRAPDISNEHSVSGNTLEIGTHHHDDPKVLLREFSRKLVQLGYRKDNMFSRPDVDQLFFAGLSGPALFIKVLKDTTELGSFLRVLEHRKDALGILITRTWDPVMEGISRIRGFIYLDWDRAWRADEVVRAVIKEGEN